jgi:hypothetical protein
LPAGNPSTPATGKKCQENNSGDGQPSARVLRELKPCNVGDNIRFREGFYGLLSEDRTELIPILRIISNASGSGTIVHEISFYRIASSRIELSVYIGVELFFPNRGVCAHFTLQTFRRSSLPRVLRKFSLPRDKRDMTVSTGM